jgi:hypothetical protein
MNKFFDNFYHFKGFGPAIKATMPSQEALDYFKDKLPNRLLEYWQEYGFCGWGEGIFWTVNPADYSEILDLWLAGTPFVGKDNYYVIGRTVFGRLLIWGEASGPSLDINPCYGMIFPTDETEELKETGGDMSIDLFFSSASKSSMEEEDTEGKPLFERAMAKLGPLDADEMYAFVPALALGGAPKLENLQKVKVLEHLAFLAELGEKKVMADIVALSNALHRDK